VEKEKKKVEEEVFIPIIATGLERQELQAKLEGKDLAEMDYPLVLSVPSWQYNMGSFLLQLVLDLQRSSLNWRTISACNLITWDSNVEDVVESAIEELGKELSLLDVGQFSHGVNDVEESPESASNGGNGPSGSAV
ncbi:hypothetical protein GIB67_027846, partial [Kingdonia uniflora]